ncbi:hypothetical protein [Microbacterium oxydans]|uniref:hypothetical protein n=1 Tax=Microbacterium oxydans TaxID=82380 RepID=UPI00366F042A
MTVVARSTDAQTISPDLVLTEWVTENEPQSIVHRILGRSDVDVTLRPALDATGTLRLFFLDHTHAEQARAFHLAAAWFAVTTTDARLPAQYVPNGPIRKAEQENNARWVIEVPFQEIRS